MNKKTNHLKFKVGDIVKITKIWLNDLMLDDDETIDEFKDEIGKVGRIIDLNKKFLHTKMNENENYIYILDVSNVSWNFKELKIATKKEKEQYVLQALSEAI